MPHKRKALIGRIRVILSDLELLDGLDTIEENTGLLGKGIGMDSVEIIQMVAALEEEFGLTIDDNDLLPDHFQTLGTLVTFLEEKFLL